MKINKMMIMKIMKNNNLYIILCMIKINNKMMIIMIKIMIVHHHLHNLEFKLKMKVYKIVILNL